MGSFVFAADGLQSQKDEGRIEQRKRTTDSDTALIAVGLYEKVVCVNMPFWGVS